VVLEGLDNIEVGSFTLRESVLAVKLELSGDDRVLTPAVHVKGSLGKNEGSGIRKTRCADSSVISRAEWELSRGVSEPCSIGTSRWNINSTSHLEKTRGGDEGIRTRGLSRSSEGVDGVRKGIDGVSVVERLSSKDSVKKLRSIKR